MNAIDRIGQNPVPSVRPDTLVSGTATGMGARTAGPGAGSIAQQQTTLTRGTQAPRDLRASLPAVLASTYSTVSADAKVLSALAELPSESPVVLSDKPLCPVPPTQSTSSAGLPTIGAHFTSLLTKSLMQSLENSGLFYESHLAQWASGQRPLSSIEKEPQARLVPLPDSSDASAAQDGSAGTAGRSSIIAAALSAFHTAAGDRGANGTGGFAGADTTGGGGAAPAGGAWLSRVADVIQDLTGSSPRVGAANGAESAGNPAQGSTAAHPGATAQGDAAAPATLMEVLSHLSPFAHHPGSAPVGQTASTDNMGAHALHANALTLGAENAAARSDGSGAALPSPLTHTVHPDLLPTVRQQMELLQNPVLRWTGEAWPGAKMDWTIERRDEGGAHTMADEVPEPAWHMALSFDLPHMGTVDAEFHLVGERLVTKLKASPDSAAVLLHDSDYFRERIAGTGLELKGLTVRERQAGEEAGTPGAAGVSAGKVAGNVSSAGSATGTGKLRPRGTV